MLTTRAKLQEADPLGGKQSEMEQILLSQNVVKYINNDASTSMHVFRAVMKQKAVCTRALHVSRGTVGVLA